MKIEDFFNQSNLIDLSFFNFRNAITAAYFADSDLRIIKVNDNFKRFFPILGNHDSIRMAAGIERLGISLLLNESVASLRKLIPRAWFCCPRSMSAMTVRTAFIPFFPPARRTTALPT